VYFPCDVNLSDFWVEAQCSSAPYEVAYLTEGDKYHVDRTYKIDEIPSKYKDLLWIKTAMDDKFCDEPFKIHFNANTDVTCYVAYDPRDTPVSWVTETMVDTGDVLETTNPYMGYLRIFEKSLPAGHSWLGPNIDEESGPSINAMYVVMFRCKK
jgi:hypothetical protein